MTPPALALTADASDICSETGHRPPLFLIGERVGLRPLCEADATPRYLAWLQDPDITRHLETGAFPQSLDALREYVAQRAAPTVAFPSSLFFAIQHLETGRHIGNIKLEPIHWLHRTATLGMLIGDKDFQGQGLGEEGARLCLRYAFDRLGLRKVSLGVLASNTRAVRLYQRVGFVIEGCRREEFWSHGQFHDAYWMGLFAGELMADS